MNRKLKNSGQAPIEMAIFGTLILLSFSALLLYAQRFDAQQQVMMETFRKALKEAYEKNSSVSFSYNKPVHFANLFGGYREGQSSNVGSSSAVMWVKGLAGPSGKGNVNYSLYQIGNTAVVLPRHPKEVGTITGYTTEVQAPEGVWKQEAKKEIHYQASTEKKEENPSITNTRRGSLDETNSVILHTRWDKKKGDPREPWDSAENAPDYIYYPPKLPVVSSENLGDSRTWVTSHD